MQRILKILALMSADNFRCRIRHGATITGTVKGPDGRHSRGVRTGAEHQDKITVNVLSHRTRVSSRGFAGRRICRADSRRRYQADPRTGVTLTASQSASMDWALKPGTVRWRDLRSTRAKS